MTTADRVREIIRRQTHSLPEDVKDHAKICDELGADSLDFVEASIAIEEAFKIQIPDKELDKIVTVGDMIQCVSTKVL